MISQHWFRWWLGAINHYLDHCWVSSTGTNELKQSNQVINLLKNLLQQACYSLHMSVRYGDILWVNTLRPRQNCHHFADDIFKCIFLNKNVWISIKISLKFVPKGQINNIPALVQIMAWCRPGDKPLFESMMVSLLMHICVTRPQWVKNMIYILPLYSTFIALLWGKVYISYYTKLM